MTHSARATHTGAPLISQGLTQEALRYQTSILQLVRTFGSGNLSQESVHLVRTQCRRLQALLELAGDQDRAAAVARAIRRLSRIRALHVFRSYLKKLGAPRRDLRAVESWIEEQEDKLRRNTVYRKIERAIWKHGLPSGPDLDGSLTSRLAVLRQTHGERLEEIITEAGSNPRRKRLHALRLMIKDIRYQTECLPSQGSSKQTLVSRLKAVQDVLGRYEELAAFRHWAEDLDLTVRDRIIKDWRRARKRARAIPAELDWLVDALVSGHVWAGSEKHVPLVAV